MTVEAPTLQTERLLLRSWRVDDLDDLASMNADPEVMQYFPACLDRDESAGLMTRNADHIGRHGFAWWALEVPGAATFAGAVALLMPRFEAHFTPCFEIGWRLPRAFWGRGYATEAAAAVVDFAFDRIELDDVVAFTASANERSRNVMTRLGMAHCPADDFGHPHLAVDHPLRHHVLYRLSRQTWRQLP